MLKIQIEDDNSEEGMCWEHFVAVDTMKADIMLAIETLYPTARSISIEVVEAG